MVRGKVNEGHKIASKRHSLEQRHSLESTSQWMDVPKMSLSVPTNLMPKPNKELLFNVYGPIAIDSCFVKEVVMMVMDKAKLLAL